MKKEAIFVFFVFIFLLSITNITISITGEAITGKAITGKASAQSTNVSITVISADTPGLTIRSPENRTYPDMALLLNYTSTNADNIWYNFDSGANTTITSFTYINISEGSHTFYLYANNSNGLTTENVSFFVNLSYGWYINYTKYSGNTTNLTMFQYMGKEYMQNITNFTMEIPNFGKIVFNMPVNMSREFELNDYSDMASNSIYIDSNQVPELNISATIWIYNLTYTNPRILFDNQVCPSTICTRESYLGGILKFNVTSFSTYSSEETPSSSSSTGGGGSGGGGGTASIIREINLDKEKIKVTLRQGDIKKEEIKINNIGNQKIKILISTPNLEYFMKISEKSLELNAGESKIIALEFVLKEDILPNLYIGKLIIEGDGIKKEVIIAIEVESKKPLFDVKVEIPKKFLYVMPGEELLANIKLYSLVEIGKVDVKLEYFTNDDEGKIIVSESETISVENQTSFVKEFVLPENIKFGAYILYVKAIYNGQVASASAWFMISQKPFWTLNRTFFVITAAIILVFILIILIELRKLRGHMERYMKINENILVKEKIIKLKPNNPKLLKGGKKWI